MSSETTQPPPVLGSASTASYTLRDLLLYFLRLGTLGFGGPIALAGHMQKDLVEERRWVSKQDYLEGLAFAQLSPGPLAAQLAMYLGWIRAGTLAATLAGELRKKGAPAGDGRVHGAVHRHSRMVLGESRRRDDHDHRHERGLLRCRAGIPIGPHAARPRARHDGCRDNQARTGAG